MIFPNNKQDAHTIDDTTAVKFVSILSLFFREIFELFYFYFLFYVFNFPLLFYRWRVNILILKFYK